ncbi:MAG: immunoglobulin-like domain-containing protein [Enterococcus sp.]
MKKKQLVTMLAISVVGFSISMSQTALAEEKQMSEESVAATSTTQSPSKEQTSSTSEEKEIAPKFIGLENRTIEVSQPFDPKAGVSATDEKEGTLTDKMTISGKVDTQKVGDYSLVYSVKNAQAKETKQTIMVRVQAKKVTVYQVEIADFSLPKNANISEEIQRRMVIKDKDNQVIQPAGVTVIVEEGQATTTLGTLPVKFSVKFTDGTIVNKTVDLTIFSGIRIVTPKEDYKYYGTKYEDGIDLLDYIEVYEINSQGKEISLTSYNKETGIGIEVIKSDLDVTKPGRYSLVYRVSNSLGETVEHTSYVRVMKKNEVKAPTIKVENQVMYVGDRLTKEMILGWAETSDADQVSFEVQDDQILVDSLTQRLEKATTYKILYTASRVDETTQAELHTEATMTLTVKEKKTTPTTDESTTTGVTTTTKKVLPTNTTPTASKAKSLPKTGSERSNLSFIVSGIVFVGIALFSIVKKYRVTD